MDKPFRVRFTWGQGSWSFEYCASLDEARARRFSGGIKTDYTPWGSPRKRIAIRAVIQTQLGSKWKTLGS